VDDVVLFLRPEANDIAIIMDLVNIFGDDSGLRTNLQKSNVLTIRCGEQELAVLQNLLPCALAEFPCRYVGLPLSLRKLTKVCLHQNFEEGSQGLGSSQDRVVKESIACRSEPADSNAEIGIGFPQIAPVDNNKCYVRRQDETCQTLQKGKD